jgi:predicted nuclease of restriction endonuclease-like (RecB) superfamily
LDQLADPAIREWYLRAAVEYGWSRNVLVLQIKSGLHEREGKALTNFQRVLPPPDSDLAERILKDPYNFDFLTVTGSP